MLNRDWGSVAAHLQEEDVERRAELVLCEAAKVGGREFATARSLSAQRGRLNLLLVAHLCRIHGDRFESDSNEHVAELGDRRFNGVNIRVEQQLLVYSFYSFTSSY